MEEQFLALLGIYHKYINLSRKQVHDGSLELRPDITGIEKTRVGREKGESIKVNHLQQRFSTLLPQYANVQQEFLYVTRKFKKYSIDYILGNINTPSFPKFFK